MQSFPENTEAVGFVFSLTFSPNGSVLASGGENFVKLWLIDPIPFDFDGDGMSDSWERKFNLDPANFWDKFTDPDQDGLINGLEFFLATNATNNDSDADNMPDGWEYLGGLNPIFNDSSSDNDGDGMNNLYEYQTNLNVRINDAQNDQDNDGMPNLWECIHGFDANDPTDAAKDADGDWVSNVAEYNGGSDPQNFWSVPLFSLSIIHLGGFLLFSVLIVLLGSMFMYIRRKTLTRRLHTPDFVTASKIWRAGYSNYASFLQAETEAKKLAKTANSLYYQGIYSKAIQHYKSALTIFESLESNFFIAETIFNLCRILKDLDSLNPDHSVIQRVPQSSKNEPMVEIYRYMINALLFETQKDWLAAEKSWQLALNSEGLKEKKYCDL